MICIHLHFISTAPFNVAIAVLNCTKIITSFFTAIAVVPAGKHSVFHVKRTRQAIRKGKTLMARKSARLPAPHFLVPSTAHGWFVCLCGCGYVAVCLHCVPFASRHLPTTFCDAEQWRLKIGPFAVDHQQMHDLE